MPEEQQPTTRKRRTKEQILKAEKARITLKQKIGDLIDDHFDDMCQASGAITFRAFLGTNDAEVTIDFTKAINGKKSFLLDDGQLEMLGGKEETDQ